MRHAESEADCEELMALICYDNCSQSVGRAPLVVLGGRLSGTKDLGNINSHE
jgi:hypothetical protein